MFKLTSLAVVTVVAALAAPHASADQYLKAQIGQTTATVGDDSCDYMEAIASEAGVSSKCEDSDLALRIAYGFAFNDHFALEGGYNDFGSLSAKAFDANDYIKVTTDITGFDVNAVGRLPLNDTVTLVGRAGALIWDVEAKLSSTFLGSTSESSSGTSLLLGVGAEFRVFSAGFITADYDFADDVGDEDEVGEGKVARFSAGFKFKF